MREVDLREYAILIYEKSRDEIETMKMLRNEKHALEIAF